MQQLIDKLNSIKPEDFKDPAKLPKAVRAFALVAIVLAVVVIGIFYDTKQQQFDIEQLQVQEEELKTKYLEKKKQAINLALYQQQLKEVQQSFEQLLLQLPDKAQMDALLKDVNQIGITKNLSFDLFKPAASENLTSVYAEQPVAISLVGSFDNIGKFSEDVSRLSRIVNIEEISLRPQDTNKPFTAANGNLTLEATAKTYRYMTREELSKVKNKK